MCNIIVVLTTLLTVGITKSVIEFFLTKIIPFLILIPLASLRYFSYLSISFFCPLKAYTVLIADKTSSAIAPAFPEATASFLDSRDEIYEKKKV